MREKATSADPPVAFSRLRHTHVGFSLICQCRFLNEATVHPLVLGGGGRSHHSRALDLFLNALAYEVYYTTRLCVLLRTLSLFYVSWCVQVFSVTHSVAVHEKHPK